MSGYVLLYRSLIGHPHFRGKDDEYAAIWLLVHAAWGDTQIRVAGRSITLQRGQCCYALSYLAEAWECSKATAHARLRHFARHGFVQIQIQTGLTLITLCHYDHYQDGWRTGQTPPDRLANDGRPNMNQDKAENPLLDDIGRQVLAELGVEGTPFWLEQLGRVAAWQQAGADPQLDIYPTLRRIMQRRCGRPPNSLHYFDRAIARAVALRTRPLTMKDHCHDTQQSGGSPSSLRGQPQRRIRRRADLAATFADCLADE